MKASDIVMHSTFTSMASVSTSVHSVSGSPTSPWSGQTSILFYFLIAAVLLFIGYLAYGRFLDTQEVKDE